MLAAGSAIPQAGTLAAVRGKASMLAAAATDKNTVERQRMANVVFPYRKIKPIDYAVIIAIGGQILSADAICQKRKSSPSTSYKMLPLA